MSEKRIPLFQTEDTPCGYLPDLVSRNVITDPEYALNGYAQERLLEKGFRQYENLAYRPACPSCSACKAVRIPVEEFRPNRTQRKTRNRNSDLRCELLSHEEWEQSFDLFSNYLEKRHKDGIMWPTSTKAFSSFLGPTRKSLRYLGVYLKSELIGVSVFDSFSNSYSAVYTYFDPDQAQRSLGTLAVLELIDRCKFLNKEYVYLGYWVKESPKMAYKSNFQPAEILSAGKWQRLESL